MDFSHLNLWISVVARTVQELDFDLSLGSLVLFNLNHYHFDNLVVLKLRGFICLNINSNYSICLPSLESLSLFVSELDMESNVSLSFPKLKYLLLKYVKFRQEDSVQNLFSSCPILDDLNMNTGDWKSTLVVRIPSLTKLSLSTLYDSTFGIQIDAVQKLQSLSIRSGSLMGLITGNISSDFHDLRQLKVEVYDCHEWSFVIKNMLGNMENLEHLFLPARWECSCSQKSWWTEPLIMPKCLLSRVTSIHLFEIKSHCQDDLEMVKYFLKNAKVLRVLKLGISKLCSSERKHQLVQEISMTPKRSKACQVVYAST